LEHQEISADKLEERLRQIWQKSYAHYAVQEESRLQAFYVRRGLALKIKVYPIAYQRRRLYRTGLPPRSGNQLLELYPSFKEDLEKGKEYARWNSQDRFIYIQTLVEQLTSLPQYKREDKTGRSRVNWIEVLQWWLNPTTIVKKSPKDVSAWYKYVSDN